MTHTAALVSQWYGYPTFLAMPALSDHTGASNRMRTNYLEVAELTLQHLQSLNFRHHPSFIWSHHNYKDVEQYGGARTDALRNVLIGRWKGRSLTDSATGQNPSIWLTEGGARLGPNIDQTLQAFYVGQNWDRMTAAPGVEMYGNHLMYGKNPTQSGLRNDVDPATSLGAPRLVWDQFRSFPPRF